MLNKAPVNPRRFMMGDIAIMLGPVAEQLQGASIVCAGTIERRNEILVNGITTNKHFLPDDPAGVPRNHVIAIRPSSLLYISPPESMYFTEDNPYRGTPYYKGRK